MPAAIAIPAIISAAGSVASAVTQHKAANKAEKAQVGAANQARDLQGAVYQQQRADLSPYRATGNAALTRLSGLLGVTPQDTPMVPQMQQALQPQAPAAPSAPSPGLPASVGGMNPAGQFAGQVNASGKATALRGPDGSIRVVPNEQVEHFLAKGATRVQ